MPTTGVPIPLRTRRGRLQLTPKGGARSYTSPPTLWARINPAGSCSSAEYRALGVSIRHCIWKTSPMRSAVLSLTAARRIGIRGSAKMSTITLGLWPLVRPRHRAIAGAEISPLSNSKSAAVSSPPTSARRPVCICIPTDVVTPADALMCAVCARVLSGGPCPSCKSRWFCATSARLPERSGWDV